MNPRINGIGPSIKVLQGVVPLNRAAATAKGAAIDRTGFQSCVLQGFTGVLESNPSAYSVDVKLQHSDTTTDGDFSDFTPVSGSAPSGAIAQITAESTSKRKAINLNSAKKYIRAVLVVGAFTGGTSPKLNCGATIVLGGAVETPAQSDD
jgi:hypothetical protein